MAAIDKIRSPLRIGLRHDLVTDGSLLRCCADVQESLLSEQMDALPAIQIPVQA